MTVRVKTTRPALATPARSRTRRFAPSLHRRLPCPLHFPAAVAQSSRDAVLAARPAGRSPRRDRPPGRLPAAADAHEICRAGISRRTAATERHLQRRLRFPAARRGPQGWPTHRRLAPGDPPCTANSNELDAAPSNCFPAWRHQRSRTYRTPTRSSPRSRSVRSPKRRHRSRSAAPQVRARLLRHDSRQRTGSAE